jgi:hypothetical protein
MDLGEYCLGERCVGLAVAKVGNRKAREREQGEAMTNNEQISKMKKPPVVSAEEWQKAWQLFKYLHWRRRHRRLIVPSALSSITARG